MWKNPYYFAICNSWSVEESEFCDIKIMII